MILNSIKKIRCKTCHKWFIPKRKTQITCSVDCATKRRNFLKKERRDQLKVISCEICGDPFFPKRANVKYCKKKSCKDKAKEIKYQLLKEKREKRKGRRCQYILDEWESTERICNRPVKKGNYFFCEDHLELAEDEHQATGY